MAELIPVNPIDEPVDKIPVEPDSPIDSSSPEATIIVGDGTTEEAQLSANSIAGPNVIEGTENPDILFSTPGNDDVVAKGGDDTIFGSLGDDFYDGGDGFDTLDYTQLGQKITLLPRGFIGNGSSQGSNILRIERIIGAPKQDNTIDGSGGKSPVFFTIDLSDDLLIVNDTPTLGDVEFVVENFVNVEGTENADSIIGNGGKNKLSGNGGNDSLIGKLGNDTLIGGSGDDTLIGTDPELQNVGVTEKDVLTGGTGTDKYVLGNESGSFYDDLDNKDFAKITDFSFGEQINLGEGETYNVDQKNNGFNIFVVEDFGRDLIAKVTISSGISSAKSANNSLMAASNTLDSSALTAISSDSLTSESELTGDFTTINFTEQGITIA